MNYNRPVTEEEWSAIRGEHPFSPWCVIADKIVQVRLAEAEKEMTARDTAQAAKPDNPAWTVADELGSIADMPCKLVGPCAGKISWDVIEITRSGGRLMQFRSREAAFNYVSDTTLVQTNGRQAYIIVPSTRKTTETHEETTR